MWNNKHLCCQYNITQLVLTKEQKEVVVVKFDEWKVLKITLGFGHLHRPDTFLDKRSADRKNQGGKQQPKLERFIES